MVQETPTIPQPKFNPWLEIWYRPRTTIRQIVQFDVRRGVFLLAILAGYSHYLQRASFQALGDSQSFMAVIGSGVIQGVVGGIISLAVSTFGVSLIAKRLGGEAETDATMAALAWGQAPVIFTLGLWVLRIAIYQDDVFRSRIMIIEEYPSLSLLFIPLMVAGILIVLGQFTLTVLILAEVNRFSVWRSVGTLLITIVVVGVPFLACFGIRLFPL